MTTKLLMKKLYLVALSIAAVLLFSRPVCAQQTFVTNSIATISDTAAATLLVPYFEVDLANPAGMNTIFTINNTGAQECFPFNNGTLCQNSGATAVLAHVTIWSDLSVPVFNFNVYLTGYDVETVDMRKVLAGTLPRTATAGQDPGDTISPHGSRSQDINFASCNPAFSPPTLTAMGGLPPATLTAVQLDNLVRSLTGNPSPENGGLCAGVNHGDSVARGYVTVDTVNNCTARFANDPAYIADDITFQTQLTGEVYYQDPNHVIAYGGNLVHIHASLTDPATTTAGAYTFYGRYDPAPFNAADHRQPLPTNFAARFLSGVPGELGHHIPGEPQHSFHRGSTSLIVWRDSKTVQNYFTCPAVPGVRPAWYPLGQENIFAFDEQEHPQQLFTIPFPAETQKVKVGGLDLPTTYLAGWFFLDLNTTIAGNPNPSSDPAAAQAWVDVVEQDVHQAENVMHPAQAIDSGTSPSHAAP